MRRGEVWQARLAPRSGSEQSGRRPVLIVSNDGFNAAEGWRSVIVVPFSTSGLQRGRVATAVAFSKGRGGLPRPSVAVCHQVTTLDRAKLELRLGALTKTEMLLVEDGLTAALDIIR